MENLNKAESLRQALAILGPTTSQKLSQFTGFPVSMISPLLGTDLKSGRVVRGWNGKQRIYGLEGTIDNPSPSRLELPTPVRTRTERSDGRHLTYAEQARALERADDFDSAVPLWFRAANHAVNPENVNFYQCRAEFCEVARIKSWSYCHE
ncbi:MULTISPECIES: ANR family transcriptional regulator [unclassified Serratia (in: enterobacteria)]|uniref:ANR family transcriptional regulator n=1 Tax=unclassified Serratia (in: enterobacteria) TaxID=2647522 RepID=UPI00046911D5|nr:MULTISPECIES: ANR family transcriptional regulator [unclassified Serratia (in: enterobacteria)]